jgi:hypothetical protein
MIQMLKKFFRQWQPIDPNPFSLELLDELIHQFGQWEVA